MNGPEKILDPYTTTTITLTHTSIKLKTGEKSL